MDRQIFEFKVRYAIRYAELRHVFFRNVSYFLTILGIAGLWASGLAPSSVSFVIGAVSSVLLVVNCVVNFQERSCFWERMFDDYNSVFSDFIALGSRLSDDDLAALNKRLMAIDVRCKGCVKTLTEVAYNLTIESMGWDPANKFRISGVRFLFRNFV